MEFYLSNPATALTPSSVFLPPYMLILYTPPVTVGLMVHALLLRLELADLDGYDPVENCQQDDCYRMRRKWGPAPMNSKNWDLQSPTIIPVL